MKAYNPKEPIVSFHIAKAGGTSFKKILQSWFHIGYHSHYRNYKNLVDPPKHMGLRYHLHKIIPVCIHGHFDESLKHGAFEYYPNVSQFFTILRDPYEMWVSMYNYLLTTRETKGVLEDFKSADEFFYNDNLNMLDLMPFEFTLENYQKIIEEKFVHIGIMEAYSESVKLLAEKLGKKPIPVPHMNQSKFDFKPSKDAEAFFREKNKLEFAIYEFAKRMNHL